MRLVEDSELQIDYVTAKAPLRAAVDGGRGSRRIQRGGFDHEQDARAALERELEKLRRRNA